MVLIAEIGRYVVTQSGPGEKDFEVREYYVDGNLVEDGLTRERAVEVANQETEGDRYEAHCLAKTDWMFDQNDYDD